MTVSQKEEASNPGGSSSQIVSSSQVTEEKSDATSQHSQSIPTGFLATVQTNVPLYQQQNKDPLYHHKRERKLVSNVLWYQQTTLWYSVRELRQLLNMALNSLDAWLR